VTAVEDAAARVHGPMGLRHAEPLGREIRQEPPARLGRATYWGVADALAAGEGDAATRLARYMVLEYRIIYGFCLDWARDLAAGLGRRAGPAAVAATARATRARYPAARRAQWDLLAAPEVPAVEARLDRIVGGTERADDPGAGELAALEAAAARGGWAPAAGALESLWRTYLVPHDFLVAWIHDLLTAIAERSGEDAVLQAVTETYERGWRPRYARWDAMSPELRLALSVEGMRGHLSGPGRKGDVEVVEEADRYVMRLGPCGSGAILRFGDPASGAGPYGVEGASREVHPWTWGRAGVLWYSAHCPIVTEWLTTRDRGVPLRPVEPPEHAGDPCRWYVYKDPARTRPEHFRRMGLTPPGSP
jgi:hypothetical protein